MPLYQEIIASGVPVVRIYKMLGSRYLTHLEGLHLIGCFGDERLRLGAIKFFHGNSLSGRTCWLSEPYDMVNPKTGKKDYYGIRPGRSQEELDKLVYDIHAAGFQIACHANGDREIDMVLDAIEMGKLADFVVLSQDPTQTSQHRIKDITVERTYVGGRLAFVCQ